MIHRNELAQAEALVEQEKRKQARKATALRKKLMKEIQGQFSRFTKIHQAHVEHMVLLCNVSMYLKSSR